MKINDLIEFLNKLQNNGLDTIEFGAYDCDGEWHKFDIEAFIAEEGIIAFEENENYMKQSKEELLEALDEIEHMARQFQGIASDALNNNSEEWRQRNCLE